jgi:hypothetical protein
MRGRRGPDCNIELGLAVSALSLTYGQTRTQEELSFFCNCDRRTIQKIEERGLRKLRHRLRHNHELLEGVVTASWLNGKRATDNRALPTHD